MMAAIAVAPGKRNFIPDISLDFGSPNTCEMGPQTTESTVI